MAKKHAGYVPQKRPEGYRRMASAQTEMPLAAESENSEVAAVETVGELAGYDEIFDIMEVHDGAVSDDPQNIAGLLLETNLVPIIPAGEQPNEDDVKLASLLSAITLIEGAQYLKKSFAIDLVTNPNAVNVLPKAQKFAVMQTMMMRRMQALGNGENYLSQLAQSGATTLFIAFSLTKGNRAHAATNFADFTDVASRAITEMFQDDVQDEDKGSDFENNIGKLAERSISTRARIADHAMANPVAYRLRNHRFLKRLMQPDMVDFVHSQLDTYEADWLRWSESDWEIGGTESATPTLPEVAGGEIVDYSILPKGTSVREYTQMLCGNLPVADKAYVDLRRVAVLEKFGKYLVKIPRTMSTAGPAIRCSMNTVSQSTKLILDW